MKNLPEKTFSPSLIKHQCINKNTLKNNMNFSSQFQPNKDLEENEGLLIKFQAEQIKTQKLGLKLKEKEKIIVELQEFNKKIRIDYEKSQKDLMQLIEDKNQCIELKTLKITSLEKKINESPAITDYDSKINITPLNKSKNSPSDLISTKNSFKNAVKPHKSQRSLNFDASDFLDFPHKIDHTKNKPLTDENLKDFQCFLKGIFDDILDKLSISYLDEILPKITELLSKVKEFELFHQCLGKAIKDCSPIGLWKDHPTVKEQWKWVKNIMIEYMNLKKNEKNFKLSMSQFISPKLSYRFYEENNEN